MYKILIVEDNETIIKGLKYFLEQEEFKVDISKTALSCKQKLKENTYDLVILDITLPDGDGFQLCKYIKENMNVSIIFLTAKDEEQDVVLGFDLGANDYIIKPFRNRELLSRINNVLKRASTKENKIKSNGVCIDLDAAKVYLNGDEIEFTALEYKILVYLYSNMGRIITREQILDRIWDESGNFVNDNTLTVYIKRIRTKLKDLDNIKTIKGIGYRVEKIEVKEDI